MRNTSPSHDRSLKIRDVNGIIKDSLKMPGSRGRIGPGGVTGQRPVGETEFSHFYSLKIGLSWTCLFVCLVS